MHVVALGRNQLVRSAEDDIRVKKRGSADPLRLDQTKSMEE